MIDCCERDPAQREHKHPYSAAPDWPAAVEQMRTLGVTRLRTADFEIELGPAPALPAGPEAPAPIGIEHGGEPTEEQLLYWSTKAVPTVQQPEVK